jgi:nicotinamidase/pyrazinamidase
MGDKHVLTNVNLDSPDALIVVNVQNDFCSGGRLAVEGADTAMLALYHWIELAVKSGTMVVASRCWHPPRQVSYHASYKERGGTWPQHCFTDSRGADFYSDLELSEEAVIVSKGASLSKDSYSAFDNTGLGERLRRVGVRGVWIGGLAQDGCVRASILDALAENFETYLIQNATRPANLKPDDGKRATEEMLKSGAQLVDDRA